MEVHQELLLQMVGMPIGNTNYYDAKFEDCDGCPLGAEIFGRC